MKRIITIFAASAALISPTVAVAAPWNGYHNMSFLGRTITRLVNNKLKREHNLQCSRHSHDVRGRVEHSGRMRSHPLKREALYGRSDNLRRRS